MTDRQPLLFPDTDQMRICAMHLRGDVPLGLIDDEVIARSLDLWADAVDAMVAVLTAKTDE